MVLSVFQTFRISRSWLTADRITVKKGLRERPRTSSTGDLLAGAAPRRKRSRRGVAQTLPKRGRHGVRRSQSSASPRQSIGDLTEDYRGKLTLDLRENLVSAGSRVKLTLLRRHGVSEQEQSHRAPRSADTMPAQVSKEIGETVRHPSARFTDSGGHSSFARGHASKPAGMSDSSFGKSTIAPIPNGEMSWLRRTGL